MCISTKFAILVVAQLFLKGMKENINQFDIQNKRASALKLQRNALFGKLNRLDATFI